MFETLLRFTPEQRAETYASMTEAEADAFLDDWEYVWARPSQRFPDWLDWNIWLIMAGRGFGKTRTGAEFIKDRVRKGAKRIALVGATAADVRDTMVLGESGILGLHWRKDEMPVYEPSKARIIWPNGAVAKMYSAEKPNRLRGPQHECAWADEIGAWKYADAWDQLMFGLRLGDNPQVCATTTPKPIPLIFDLVKRAVLVREATPGKTYRVLVTEGTTYENVVNLASSWLVNILEKYKGTRLGEQELEARLLRDVPGALWTQETIEVFRQQDAGMIPQLKRIVIGVDPGGSSGKVAEDQKRETGIVAVGLGIDNHYYILADVSGTLKPLEWGRRVTDLYRDLKADRVVAEKNYGGEMVESNINTVDPNVPVRLVNASRGKAIRAEPVSSLYAQGKCHHVGMFGAMESEMTTWVPDLADKQPSPNRMDALVWAITALMEGRVAPPTLDVTASDDVSPYGV